MAAALRHWKEKSGRFYARVAVPKCLVAVLGKTELTESLGGDLRVARRGHAAAVARLHDQIERAKRQVTERAALAETNRGTSVAGQEDLARLVWTHHQDILSADEQTRAGMPTIAELQAEYDRLMARFDAGEFVGESPIRMINVYTDYELMHGARDFDHRIREGRLKALRAALGRGEDRHIEETAQRLLHASGLRLDKNSPLWPDFKQKLMRAEIEALTRTLERDEGDYAGQSKDPVVQPPKQEGPAPAPLPLKDVFGDYIASRQLLGKHKDGARRWEGVIEHLVAFLGHDDLRRITKRNLIDWRDRLVAEGRSAKTVADVYLASVRALLRWAYDNDRLSQNVAQTVRQEVPRRMRTRERGYTEAEAIKVLGASVGYRSGRTDGRGSRESPPLVAAKRWLPLLCAFTGARVTEMAQLRKEDVRQEGETWFVRITPDAGSVKTGEYRDVPLHRQIVAIGFLSFVAAAAEGPLFHSARSPEGYLSAARTTAGRVSQWLQGAGLVPEGVQPSHGWRHRFKTLGRELGLSDRIIDAIQGHAGRTASDGYGDVTLAAKRKVIDALPDYPLAERPGT